MENKIKLKLLEELTASVSIKDSIKYILLDLYNMKMQ
jgi:hypothetical protein